jgi:multicomponent Na+:H+ antiporter subunit D
MCLAMILFAALCILIGVVPGPLYTVLPFPVDYIPYGGDHVVDMLQLLLFSGLAFFICLPLMRRTLTICLDFDWFYRAGAPRLIRAAWSIVWPGYVGMIEEFRAGVSRFIAGVFRHHGPEGALARSWPTGSMALWVAVLLGGLLVLYYAGRT